MEEAVGTGCDGLIAIDSAWADDADGGCELTVLSMHVLHHTSLDRRGMRTQEDVLGHIIGMLRDEESVLHVTGRMVGSEIHLSEHVQIVFHLWSIR